MDMNYNIVSSIPSHLNTSLNNGYSMDEQPQNLIHQPHNKQFPNSDLRNNLNHANPHKVSDSNNYSDIQQNIHNQSPIMDPFHQQPSMDYSLNNYLEQTNYRYPQNNSHTIDPTIANTENFAYNNSPFAIDKFPVDNPVGKNNNIHQSILNQNLTVNDISSMNSHFDKTSESSISYDHSLTTALIIQQNTTEKIDNDVKPCQDSQSILVSEVSLNMNKTQTITQQNRTIMADDEDSDDDLPLTQKLNKIKPSLKNDNIDSTVGKSKSTSQPLKTVAKPLATSKTTIPKNEQNVSKSKISINANSKGLNTKSKIMSSEDDDDDIPLSVKLNKAQAEKRTQNAKQNKTVSIKREFMNTTTPQKKMTGDKVKLEYNTSPTKETISNHIKKSSDSGKSIKREHESHTPSPIKSGSSKITPPDSNKRIKTEFDTENSSFEQKKSKTSVSSTSTKTSIKSSSKTTASLKGKDSIKSIKTERKLEVKIEHEQQGGDQPHVWKWWEEDMREDGVKWHTLEHQGPIFAPDYEPLPNNIHFKYDGNVVKLSPEAEEVAGFYARMIEHDYVTKEKFNENFFKDWRKVMSKEERLLITDLTKCDFTAIAHYYKLKSEERKNMTKEEKLKIKQEQEALQNKYGVCILDGRPQKIGNYKIEPPGLFRGRGDHPKMGMLKRRIQPEDVIINCGKGGKIPTPPAGHRWKEIKHDNTVTWLASWTENIQQSIKYVMLNPSSKLKGEKDWMKYETARRLKTLVDKIRAQYQLDWRSKSMLERQRGVALYFIDKLALRAGNEKDDDTADTVGCCSLRVEHLSLQEKTEDNEEYVIDFDFLGKDSIRYQNRVPVEHRVFRNIQLFMKNKKPQDELFDRLTTQILNKYLNEQMEGLTAKVFRTFNASLTLQDQLNKLTDDSSTVHEKILSYNRANRAVAILCNHQRTIPKTYGKQMENLQEKVKAKKQLINEAKAEVKTAKADLKGRDEKYEQIYAKKKQKLERLKEQLLKLELQATDKEENKTIALGTSKLNYLDPRITVAWCKKHDINIAKLYNKTQRDKFLWAIEMATADYVF